GGKEIWIQASYNPVLDADGKPVRIVKFATDITEQKRVSADAKGQLEAISRSQATIEFDLSGKIITANDNFLKAMGYRLEEVRGQHHRMFVEPDYVASQDYKTFWAALGRGEFQAAQYQRLGKGGKRIWIQATYNPIFDADGKPIKIVKFATDITAQKCALAELNENLQKLADGDLSTMITADFPEDLKELRDGFNRTLERLQGLVTEIQDATREVENAASEISSGT
ncbi:MAG: PAS domain-containing protein, partial [Geminicoccales bacterium]